MDVIEAGADDADLVAAARDFAREFVAPNAEGWERERRMPADLLREAASRFGGALVPKEHGGHGASFATGAGALGELARADLAFAFSLVVQMNLTRTVAMAGTDEQRARLLPELLAGRRIGAFCLTEPQAGTDAGALTARARREGSGWRVDGEKAWVTNGAAADLLSVYVQGPGEPGPGNIAAFFVDGADPGLGRSPPYDLLGAHAMGTCGLTLEGCRADMLFAPGDGFRAAMQGIDLARALLSAMCCAMLDAGLETALAYAGGRRAFGRPIIELQGLQFNLAEVATQLEAARLLTDRALALLDRGAPATLAAAHAKKFATRAAFDGLAQAMQAMGANGARRDQPLARHLANAKIAQYLDGATDVQNVVIGRALAKRAGAADAGDRA